MSTLHSALFDLLVPTDHWRDVEIEPVSAIEGRLTFKVQAMYEAPGLSVEKLMKLCEIFGTQKIDVDGYGHSGCETCDWGSEYGHEIEVREATKNVEEFLAWLAEPREES